MALRRIALFLVIIAVGVAACSEGGEGDSGISVDDPIGAPDAGSEYAATGDGASSATSALDTGPSVVKNAAVEIDVVRDELNSAAQAVVDLATSTKVGGFLVSSVVDTDEGYGMGDIVVKVPAPRFEQLVGDLGTVGEVTRQELEGRDLTADYLHNHSRLRRARARVASLLRRVDATEDPAARFQLREDLRAARQQVVNREQHESLIGSISSYSTIEVALAGTAPPTPPEKPALERALGTAKDITLAIVSGIVLAAGVFVPIGLLLVALWFAGAPIVRRFKPRLKTDPF